MLWIMQYLKSLVLKRNTISIQHIYTTVPLWRRNIHENPTKDTPELSYSVSFCDIIFWFLFFRKINYNMLYATV